jgi:hypothetical protein
VNNTFIPEFSQYSTTGDNTDKEKKFHETIAENIQEFLKNRNSFRFHSPKNSIKINKINSPSEAR